MRRAHVHLALAAALLIALMAAGCGTKSATPPRSPAEAPVAPAPPSAPAVETLSVPEADNTAAIAPQPPTAAPPQAAADAHTGESLPETPAAAPEAAQEGLTIEKLRAIRDGMSYGEIEALIGFPGLTISSNGADKYIVRWAGEAGVTFLAKFEEDRLVQKRATPRLAETPPPSDAELTRAEYDRVQLGMNFDEVLALLGIQPLQLTRTDAPVAIYRWQDEKGASFTARFENGRLTRKSGLSILPIQKEETPPAKEKPETAPPPDNQEDAAAQAKPDEEGEWMPPPSPEAKTAAAPPAETAPPADTASPAPAPRPGRVRVIGGTRTEETGARGNARSRRAELPDYTYSLREGRMELRIYNDSDVAVRIGIRADKRGRDLSIGPRSYRSIFLDRGVYSLYYIFSDEPDTRYASRPINLGGAYANDLEVVLFNESYDVRELRHGRPGY